MARTRKNTFDTDIEKLKQEMIHLKKRYDQKAEKLKELEQKKEEQQKHELFEQIKKSGMNIEEVMDFVKAKGINRKSK